MTLEDMGYNEDVKKNVAEKMVEGFQFGRITSEQKEQYIVFSEYGEYQAEITGNMQFSAQSRADYPAVGDSVQQLVKLDFGLKD